MTLFKTDQEKFWRGSFGNEYINRNCSDQLMASNIHLFSKIIEKTSNVSSVIEFGANIGMNLIALKNLLPQVDDFSAVEINPEATNILKTNNFIKNIYEQSIHDFSIDYKRDFVFTKGVLIHLNQDYITEVYDLLYKTSQKYICIAEYYNPRFAEIPYRGHSKKLFKRDFAGEMLEKFKDLKLIDYGFAYHKDNNFKQDDITWFLMEKVKE